MANKLGEVSLIISSVLSVILICLIMSNKFDVINKITSKVKKKIYNKSYLSIATVIIAMIMLTLLVIVTPIVENMMIPRSYPSDIANIRIGIYGSRLIFDFLLAFIFIYKAYGKRKVNRNLLVALGGYLIGNALIIIIPTLVESIILRISTNGLGFKLIYGILYLLVTGILIFMIIGINKKTIYKSNKSNKRVKDRSIVMRISLGTIIGFISSGLNLFILPLKYSILGITTINKCMAMENVMQLVVIVIAQLIVSIILIRKIRMYRKVA